MTTDRHGRTGRADLDRRHRPSGGFRAADRRRFEALLDEALAELPAALLEAAAAADAVVEEVPPARLAGADGEIPLARFTRAGADRAAVLVVYRRPVELRALDRGDLVHLLRLAAGRAIAGALGLDAEGLDDDL